MNTNETKCKALKDEFAGQPDPLIVDAERFFDGNDDNDSIGCNLMEHPGVDAFREVFARLLRRDDVQAIFALISELDPGDGCWPFTDTILVIGTIPVDELQEAVRSLEPDEVGDAEYLGALPVIAEKYSEPVLAIWWD